MSSITTSRRQLQVLEELWGGSLSAKLRAYEQKHHMRPSLRGELAKHNETHESRDTVNDEAVQ